MVWEVVSVRFEVGFCRNEEAVLGLPMRLVVSLILGMVALGSIVGWMASVGVVPEPLVVSVSPFLVSLDGNGSGVVTVMVSVVDRGGRGVGSATVIVSGLGGAGLGETNGSGWARVSVVVALVDGVGEGYLDVVVSAPSHPRFRQEAMVKVVRGPGRVLL